MTKKKTQLAKEFFKEGVTAGLAAALAAQDTTLEAAKAEYKKLVEQWFWLTEPEQLKAEAYATVLKGATV